MSSDERDDIIDPRMLGEEVAQHLARCDRCHAALTEARSLGPTAMAVWRREFAKCVASARS